LAAANLQASNAWVGQMKEEVEDLLIDPELSKDLFAGLDDFTADSDVNIPLAMGRVRELAPKIFQTLAPLVRTRYTDKNKVKTAAAKTGMLLKLLLHFAQSITDNRHLPFLSQHFAHRCTHSQKPCLL
jgi:hypothetical protein